MNGDALSSFTNYYYYKVLFRACFFFFLLCKCYRVGIKNNEKEIIAKDSQMVELKSLCLTHMPPLFLRRAVTFFFFLSVSGK